jgi:hypothetical protein
VTSPEIKPEKVTKPFQLLATWLAGLVLIDAILVYAAIKYTPYSWVNCMFAVSSVLIIPIFLVLIFLMQTKFRPEMQEDKYYSAYISNKYNKELNKRVPLDIKNLTKYG